MPYSDPDAQRRYQRAWVARRRAEFFAGKTCEWCGTGEELELHHRDPSKKVSHRLWSYSRTRVADEAAKCTVLCGPCHRRGHAEARRLEAELRHPHGTYARYQLGCRCANCRTGRREAARAERPAVLQVSRMDGVTFVGKRATMIRAGGERVTLVAPSEVAA